MLLQVNEVIATLPDGKISGMKPLADKVLIKLESAEEQTSGGVLIPDAAKEKPLVGTVVACGPGGKDPKGDITPMSVSPGNTVMYQKFAGTELSEDGQEYIVVSEMDIMAVLA